MPYNQVTQYQTLAAPPAVSLPGPSYEPPWHYPWSEPVRKSIAPALAIALIASGVFAPAFAPSRDVAFPSGSWGHPPAANRLFQYQALAFPVPQGAEIVSPDKWFKALSEPVRFPPRLLPGTQPDQEFLNTYPQSLPWIRPFSEPVRVLARLQPGLQPAVFLVDALPYSEEARWHYPWSEPVRLKPDLGASRQPFYAAEPFGLTQPERVSEDKWHYPWSEPVRFKPRLPETEQHYFEFEPEPPEFLDVPWFNWLTEPVRTKPRLPEAEQHFFEMQPAPSPFVASGWYNWLTAPVRLPLGTYAWRQPFFTTDTRPVVSFGWFGNLRDPTILPDFRRGLYARFQQTLAFSEFVFREAVSEDKWHYPWSEPVRLKPDIGVSHQPFFYFRNPNVVLATLAATETGDAMAVNLGEFSSLTGAIVSVSEITPVYARTSSAYVVSVFANVSIIEVSS